MTRTIIARTLKALANARRIHILEELEKGHGLTVGEVASRVGVSFRTTSKHLQQLAASDFVERTQHGREASYQLNRDHPLIKKLRGDLF